MLSDLYILACALSLSAICLLLFNYSFIRARITSNKEFVGVCKDIITIITIIVGSFLSYFKFFKGRTFSAKADIEFDIIVIEAPNDRFLHVIRFAMINKGTITIWNPVAKIRIKSFVENEVHTQFIRDLKESSSFDEMDEKHNCILDVGEKGFFYCHMDFHKSIWAVSYEVEITANNGSVWKNSTAIPNVIK